MRAQTTWQTQPFDDPQIFSFSYVVLELITKVKPGDKLESKIISLNELLLVFLLADAGTDYLPDPSWEFGNHRFDEQFKFLENM